MVDSAARPATTRPSVNTRGLLGAHVAAPAPLVPPAAESAAGLAERWRTTGTSPTLAMAAFALLGAKILLTAGLLQLATRQLLIPPRLVFEGLHFIHAPLVGAALLLGFSAHGAVRGARLPRILAWLTVALVAAPGALAAVGLAPPVGHGVVVAYGAATLALGLGWLLRR
jgi:hypothetical protein